MAAASFSDVGVVDTTHFLERTTTMKRNMALIVALSVLATFVFLLGGCSKATQANYEKIEMGMAYQEVVDILGAPDKTDDVMGARNCVWGKEPNTITIKFVADKVVYHAAKGLK